MVENDFNSNKISDSSKDQQTDNGNSTKKKDEQIKCPSCGTLNSKNNLFCNQCGKPFVEKLTCPRCGAEVPVFNSFCSYCGAPLKTSGETSQEVAPSSFQQHPSTENPPQSYWRNNFSQPAQQGQTYHDQLRTARLESYNMIGKIVGILFILGGIAGIGFLALMVFTSLTSTFREMISEEELAFGWGAFYGLLIAMFLVPSSIAIISGTALLRYQPDNNAWKGFYYSLRYYFLAFSGLLAFIILLTVVGWTVYVPMESVSGALPFWLFHMFLIPVDMTVLGLWIIIFLLFLLSFGLLAAPLVQKFLKKDGLKTEEVEKSEQFESNLEKISETKPEEKVELHLLLDNNKTRTKIERSKGRLPDIFYKLKYNSLVRSLELLGGAYFVSFIILLFVPTETPGLPPIEEQEPFRTIISLGWAGIAEEISFRLIIIGVPMIFVILGRFILQERKNKETKKQLKQLNWWNIPLAIRGKYKQIGIPEWILIGISSLLFGFAHWDQWTGNWPAWKIVQASVMGFFLSYAFAKYGLESAIFIHFTNNVITGFNIFGTKIGAGWISGFAAFFTYGLLLYGLMKVISWTINGIKWYQLSKAG
ncbi:MAG: CPBP family intramembrane metalloprotease [Candidatus Heimdallarchaeota archaeon]|nr:CPBP family intramembrane metalloprotease [Candidatus Heimdallarchaeota archaeon]